MDLGQSKHQRFGLTELSEHQLIGWRDGYGIKIFCNDFSPSVNGMSQRMITVEKHVRLLQSGPRNMELRKVTIFYRLTPRILVVRKHLVKKLT